MFQLSHKVPGRDFEAGEKGKRRFRPWGACWRRGRGGGGRGERELPVGGGLRARGGQWRRLHGERRPAAVLCRCGGVPARRGGDGRARELRWDESKRIRGLVEVGAGSSGGLAWRGGHGHDGRRRRYGAGRFGRYVCESEAEQSSTARCGSERRTGAREKLRATGVVACASGAVANLATVSTHGEERATRGLIIFFTKFESSNFV